jgi:hypothetical protein
MRDTTAPADAGATAAASSTETVMKRSNRTLFAALFTIGGTLAAAGIAASIAFGGGDQPAQGLASDDASGGQAAPALVSCSAACAGTPAAGMSIAVLTTASR